MLDTWSVVLDMNTIVTHCLPSSSSSVENSQESSYASHTRGSLLLASSRVPMSHTRTHFADGIVESSYASHTLFTGRLKAYVSHTLLTGSFRVLMCHTLCWRDRREFLCVTHSVAILDHPGRQRPGSLTPRHCAISSVAGGDGRTLPSASA